MSEVKKKSYSKKPSKKERLAAELAQKEQKARAQSIVTAGGVVVRADGVGVSAVALAARQKALQMAQAQDTQNTRDSDTAKSSRTRGKAKTDASASVPKIEAAQDSGKRLAQCLWCAQILLMDVLKFDAAADKQVSMFLRAHKELGARDRHIVAETVYAVLRHRRVLAHLAQTGMGALERRLVLLAAQKVVDMNSLQAAIPEEEFAWVTETLKAPIHDLPAAVRSNLPDEWFAALVGAYGEDETLKLTEALNQSAPLDIRVNTIKSSREAVQIAFEHAGIESAVCAFAPLGLRLPKKPALQKLDVFTTGAIEVQDEGSQLLTHLLGAKRGEMVADFCAGAGGKTLAIGAMMRNTGRLYAFDIAAHRLAKLKPRLARSGLSNVQAIAIDSEKDIRVKRLAGKFDRVLVDAPCSGLGTLRRNPDLKWRHGVDSVARLVQVQASILESAARLVKAGGTLVYATCSVLPNENQEIVRAFVAAHPEFELVAAREVLATQKIIVPESAERDGCLQLLPHLHQTDGFFAAYLRKAIPAVQA
jgi:16S rRNA (cytosine967-C5)-methyltransferase